jgi:hypothetical protein
MAYLMQN